MAPNARPPSLPSIPDIAFDLDEKMHLLPELDEILSSTGASSATLDEDESRHGPSRSHSTSTHHSFHLRRSVHALPSRFPSVSSSNAPTATCTYTPLPLSPRRCGYDLVCQPQPLQLPLTQKTVLESWTIAYHHPTPHTRLHIRALGITLLRCFDRRDDEGSVLSVVPNTHFSQDELAAAVAAHEAAFGEYYLRKGVRGFFGLGKGGGKDGERRLCKPRTEECAVGVGGTGTGNENGGEYAADLEKRIRKLDWKVQDEIYELLSDRVQSCSNAFRRREWRVVVLAEVPGGELTDSPTGFRVCGKRRGCFGWAGVRGLRARMRRAPDMPVTEYRLVLRGTETGANNQGWGYYNRYSQPWRAADEKAISHRRRWSSATGRSEKYVDF